MRRTKGVQGKKTATGLTTNALIEEGRDEPTHGPPLSGEEVRCTQCWPVRSQEYLPRRGSVWRRRKACVLQDLRDRRPRGRRSFRTLRDAPTTAHPDHGPDTTIQRERTTNDFVLDYFAARGS